LLVNLVLSIAIQAGFIWLNFLFARAVGLEVPIAAWAFAWALSKIISVLPVSLGGLGLREASLAALLAHTAAYGNVASCGLAASPDLQATVMPFIIRGVSLLGVASAGTARDIREEVWRRLAGSWKPRQLDAICTREATLDDLPAVFSSLLSGHALGRTLVRIGDAA